MFWSTTRLVSMPSPRVGFATHLWVWGLMEMPYQTKIQLTSLPLFSVSCFFLAFPPFETDHVLSVCCREPVSSPRQCEEAFNPCHAVGSYLHVTETSGHPMRWQAGRNYLCSRHNPLSTTWIFGIQKGKKRYHDFGKIHKNAGRM